MYGSARVTEVPPSYPDEEGLEVVPEGDPSAPVGLVATAAIESTNVPTTSDERSNAE
jgi:hypothetical protein